MMRFAIRLGSLRPNSLSCRFFRQPETTSEPASSWARSRWMSAGSFWRSPSIGTITSPRAASIPALIAAVWPKLRRKRITRSSGRSAAARASSAKVRSREPSSTQMTS